MVVTTSTATGDKGNDLITIPSARNNNLVAESDYYAAMAALQQKIKAPPSTFEHYDDHNLAIQLYSDCSNSLCNQIQKIVQPISDEAFHTYLSRFNDKYTAAPPSTDHDAGRSDTRTAVADVQFTDDELMDHVAMKRVRELRQQVRDQAQRLQQVRQSTLQRAISITERQVEVLLLRSSSSNHQDDSNSDGQVTITTEKLLEHHQSALLQMKESFLNLYESIQSNNNSVLPTQLKNEYQNTIQVIEQGLMHQPLSSPNHHLSQIEQAIYRRDYGMNNNNNINEQDIVMNDHNNEEQKHDPEQTLYNLLCR